MTTFGYRLFEIGLRQGRKHPPVDFSECNEEHYVDVAYRLLRTLETTVIGEPKLVETAGEEPVTIDDADLEGRVGEPAFQVQQLTRSDNVIRGRIFKGTVGQHDRALGVPGQTSDVDMSNLAAAQTFRFILVFPEGGEAGFAAVESIGRSCPVGLLAKWLSKQSQSESFELEQQIRDRGERVEKIPWWRFRAKPLSDEEHLQQLIHSGQLSKIQLSKKSVLPDRKRDHEKFKVTAPNIEGNVAVEVGRVLVQWWDRLNRKDRTADPEAGIAPDQSSLSDRDGASQLAAIVGPEVADIDFDDGWIVLQDDAGTTRIRPNNMPEIFTYYVGQIAPNDDDLYEMARRRTARIAAAARIDAHWPPLES